MRILTIFSLCTSVIFECYAQELRMNEVMTLNTSYYSDDGNAYPWIEFFNDHNTSTNLSDYYLSTDSSNLLMWKLPSLDIAPDSLQIVWFSGKGEGSHADFTIDTELEFLFLSNSSGEVLDLVPMKYMKMDESYGRKFDQEEQWVYFVNEDHISPGRKNLDTGLWSKIQAKADFQIGDAGYFGYVTYEDKMWILNYETMDSVGVWTGLPIVYSSSDGFYWELINPSPPYKHGSMITVFNDYLWAFDGRAFRSKDGITWELMSTNTPTSGRVASFNNYLWIITFSELYRSADGIAWEKAINTVPWYSRVSPSFLVHNEMLWMFGGNINYNSFFDFYYQDVWCTKDGTNWELVNYKAPWIGRYWSTAASFDGMIWLMGGWNFFERYEAGNGNTNDVWCSKDGKDWEQVKAPIIWSPRHAQFMWVYKNSIWVGAGFGGGGVHRLYNDIWRLTKAKQEINVQGIQGTYGDQIPLSIVSTSGLTLDFQLSDTSVVTILNNSLETHQAGEAILKVKQTGNPYYYEIDSDVKVVIDKRELIARPRNQEVPFGFILPAIEIEYDGFISGEDRSVLEQEPGLSEFPPPFSPVGAYTVKIDGGLSGNYAFTYLEGELKITKTSDEVAVFPNPVQDRVQIVFDEALQQLVEIKLYDTSGKLCFQSSYNGAQMIIEELDTLQNGLYIITINSEKGLITKKIAKI